MMDSLSNNKQFVKNTVEYIQNGCFINPRIAVVLGSGFGNFTDNINAIYTIHTEQIPDYPLSSVEGHAGKIIIGYLIKDSRKSLPILIFQGRIHFYENQSLDQVILPVLIAHQFGIRKLLLTNAAGGINKSFKTGDLMLTNDVLNLRHIFSPAFIISHINNRIDFVDSKLQRIAIQCASKLSIRLHQGSYFWMQGPSYETPAEIQMLKRIRADAVGMSTVPELFIAGILKMNALAVSLISNMVTDVSQDKLLHKNIIESVDNYRKIVHNFLANLILDIN